MGITLISSIQINNFQAHQDTFIDFNEGVNAIIGVSDSGKTSILRALTWCITNKPSGDAFQSSWGGDTLVAVTLSSGDTITRGRDKKGNYYKVNNTEFRAFGAGDPPQEVQALFNMNNINISAQMDAPFLLSSSPGEVAQILNKVVNLDIIDTATSTIRKKKLEVDRELSASMVRGNELEKQLVEYAYLEELEKDIVVLESLQNRGKAARSEKIQLQELITQYQGVVSEQQTWQELLKAEAALLETLILSDKRELISSACDTLLNLYNQGTKLQKEIIHSGKVLTAEEMITEITGLFLDYEDIQKERVGLTRLYKQIKNTQESLQSSLAIEKASAPVNAILTIIKSYEQNHAQLISLWGTIQDIRKIETQQEAEQAYLEDLEKQFHKLMPKECPLCGQGVK